MKTLGDSHLLERGKLLKKTIIFLRIKQFVPKKMKAICIKRLYFVQICCRTPHGVRGFKYRMFLVLFQFLMVALRMECVDLSTWSVICPILLSGRTPHGVRGFYLVSECLSEYLRHFFIVFPLYLYYNLI